MLSNRFDEEQRYRDLFIACQGRLWSQDGIRLLAVHEDFSLEEIGISTDENATTIFIEPGNFSQLIHLADQLGIDLTKF